MLLVLAPAVALAQAPDQPWRLTSSCSIGPSGIFRLHHSHNRSGGNGLTPINCHSEMALSLPDNMMTETLPAHCPELNPMEHIWDEVREKFFPNLVFDSMAAVERKLIEAILFLECSSKIVQSITGFKWIVDVLKRSNR
jgi:hypothetical protein